MLNPPPGVFGGQRRLQDHCGPRSLHSKECPKNPDPSPAGSPHLEISTFLSAGKAPGKDGEPKPVSEVIITGEGSICVVWPDEDRDPKIDEAKIRKHFSDYPGGHPNSGNAPDRSVANQGEGERWIVLRL